MSDTFVVTKAYDPEKMGECIYPSCRWKTFRVRETVVSSATDPTKFYHLECFFTLMEEAEEDKMRKKMERHANN